jgi:hypothetical protein
MNNHPTKVDVYDPVYFPPRVRQWLNELLGTISLILVHAILQALPRVGSCIHFGTGKATNSESVVGMEVRENYPLNGRFRGLNEFPQLMS